MRRYLLSLMVVGGWAALATEVRAQTAAFAAPTANAPGLGDPFIAYYAWYLPRQAALAAQPTTTQMLRDVAAVRQEYALAERQGLVNPNPAIGLEPDPLRPFYGSSVSRVANPTGIYGNTRGGQGPVTHYNRTDRYFPSRGTGYGANQNTYNPRFTPGSRRPGSFGGGFGMPFGGFGGFF
jgi:hypothetical protein